MAQVLVVDDYAALRLLLRRVLEANGYSVVEAATGSQAIEACSTGSIGTLICDLLLPDMAAPSVIAVAQSMNAKLKVVVMSGQPDSPTWKLGVSEPYPMIAKPFKMSDLLRLIGEDDEPAVAYDA